jgi:hypothetical protein
VSSILEFLSSFADKEAQEEAAKPGIARKWAESVVGLPRDVYRSGSPDVGPGEGLGYAMNALSPGMAAAPKNALGIFGGRNATKYPRSMEPVAEFMEKGGVSRDKIWEATGLERGKDKQWRFEIDDSKAGWRAGLSIDPGDSFGTVGRSFDHPELYENYPTLGRADFARVNGGENYGTYYGGDYPSIELNVNRSLPEQRSTMLHELQHGVQDIEGFARGGNTSEMGMRTPAQSDRIRDARRVIMQKRLALEDRMRAGTDGPQEKALYEELTRADRSLMTLDDQVRDPYNQYRRLAGETEARNVQERDRLRMTPPTDLEKRMDELEISWDVVPGMRGGVQGTNKTLPGPWRTEDVPRRLQNVLFR